MIKAFLKFGTLALMCISESEATAQTTSYFPSAGLTLHILGTVQDGGSPHIGCKKSCCSHLFNRPELHRNVVSLGITDSLNSRKYIFECTPDFPMQAKTLQQRSTFAGAEMPDGIFLTHAHIGHYAGLMFLGREAINSKKVPVYAMPRMKEFLETNGPWSQLVALNNIDIKSLTANEKMVISPSMSVTPLQVPHRDEFSETVGFIIEGPTRKALFIPDIDKWEKWDKNIAALVSTVDYAFVDATFYDGQEINNRNIAEIPHPFVIESMDRWKDLPAKEKQKIYFIHFNHTNPLLNPESDAAQTVRKNGFNIASSELRFRL